MLAKFIIIGSFGGRQRLEKISRSFCLSDLLSVPQKVLDPDSASVGRLNVTPARAPVGARGADAHPIPPSILQGGRSG